MFLFHLLFVQLEVERNLKRKLQRGREDMRAKQQRRGLRGKESKEEGPRGDTFFCPAVSLFSFTFLPLSGRPPFP